MQERSVTLNRSARNGLGLGLQKQKKRGSNKPHELTINEVMAGTPAEQCRQVQVGDRLIAVDGESTEEMSFPDVLKKLRSPSVTLTLARPKGTSRTVRRRSAEKSSSPAVEEATIPVQSPDSEGWSDQSDFGPWDLGDHALTPGQQLSAGKPGVAVLPLSSATTNSYLSPNTSLDSREMCNDLRQRLFVYFMLRW